jgi:hypothetical protein
MLTACRELGIEKNGNISDDDLVGLSCKTPGSGSGVREAIAIRLAKLAQSPLASVPHDIGDFRRAKRNLKI